MDVCSWDHPGVDPYQGTARAAIAALASIPAPIRAVLIERAERHDYDDVVYIDRDSIRGIRHDYESSIRSMAFGSAGRVCATVTRTGWTGQHVESAMVFCEGGFCVARPAVCNNWAVVVRAVRRADTQPGIAAESDSDVADRGTEMPAAREAVTIADHQAPDSFGDALWLEPGWSAFTPGWAYAPSNGGGWYITRPAPVPAVPEPEAWLLILAGMAAIAYVARRRAQ